MLDGRQLEVRRHAGACRVGIALPTGPGWAALHSRTPRPVPPTHSLCGEAALLLMPLIMTPSLNQPPRFRCFFP